MVHATEVGVMTLVLNAELGVNGSTMGRYALVKDWPEDSFALYIEQSVCQAVHFYWEECLVYLIIFFLVTCVNLDFGLNLADGPQTHLPLRWEEEFVTLHTLPGLIFLRK